MIADEKKLGVGALLYTPALNSSIADSVILEKFCPPYSLALDMEDSISDSGVQLAEERLISTLKRIMRVHGKKTFYLPKIFIRVRNCSQFERMYPKLKGYLSILCGFVLPKYTIDNAESYNSMMRLANSETKEAVYMMPTLETRDISDCSIRRDVLGKIKCAVDSVRDLVLNIRVGCNDFCNVFGVRRHSYETVYDILPVSQILGDIIAVFSGEYVISGPVWEYYSGNGGEWEIGLRKELELDRLNGLVGKTVIHPNQIRIVNDFLKVTCSDYNDAKSIVFNRDGALNVFKSHDGDRMNEIKTHLNWAHKVLALADIYGVK